MYSMYRKNIFGLNMSSVHILIHTLGLKGKFVYSFKGIGAHEIERGTIRWQILVGLWRDDRSSFILSYHRYLHKTYLCFH